MQVWEWILAAAGLLVLVHAIRNIVGQKHTESGKKKNPSLGCGFVILAGAIWSFVFAGLLESWPLAVRFSLGLVSALVAIGALLAPRTQLLRAAIGLAAGGLLAGPILPDVWARLKPPERQQALEAFDARVRDLRERQSKAMQLTVNLRNDQTRLERAIRDRKLTSFDKAVGDAAALADLRELAQVERMIATHKVHEAKLTTQLEDLERRRRQLSREIAMAETAGEAFDESKVEAILREIKIEPDPSEPVTLDRMAEQKALKELFERTGK